MRTSHRVIVMTLGVWCGLFGLLLICHTADFRLSPRAAFTLAFTAVCGATLTASLLATALALSLATEFAVIFVALALFSWGAMWAPTTAASALLIGGGVLLSSARIGAVLGSRVTFARYVWPLVLVAAGADLWSVLSPSGFTRQTVIDPPPSEAMNYLLLTVPIPGWGLAGVLGLGDIVFTGFLMGLARQCGLSLRRAATGVGLGFLACLVFLQVAAVQTPALLFIGPGFALALGSAVKPRWRELAQGVLFVGLLWVIGMAL